MPATLFARPYAYSLAEGNECLYPCAVLLSQALCDVSRIGALGLSSFLAHFAYGHIHTALFNCQGTFVGAVIKYAEYVMGVVFILRLITISPQVVADEKAQKGQLF